MARIRTIKPDFFHHEGISDLPALHRLLFIGLWTLADREGRLGDRPRQIKAALLPWEACDIDAMLAELDGGDFIHRYESAGYAYIDIPGFKKHQRPHPKEVAMGFPEPPSREKKRQAVKGFSTIPSSPPGKGREGKEILELGMEGTSPTSAPPPAAKPVRKASDPTWQPLCDALGAVFQEERQEAYPWVGGRDGTALKLLRAIPENSDAEILERWRFGLRALGWKQTNTIAQLHSKWADITAPEAPPRRYG